MMPREEYLATKQAFRASAAIVCRDDHDRVLVLRTTYKTNWELPGGSVDVDESPTHTVAREALEELGYPLLAGRLLCVDHVSSTDGGPGGPMFHFLFDGGTIPTGTVFTLAPDEIVEYQFASPQDAIMLVGPGLGRRLQHALKQEAQGAYLDNGSLLHRHE